jgi:hypothetical protein
VSFAATIVSRMVTDLDKDAGLTDDDKVKQLQGLNVSMPETLVQTN